MNPTHLLTEPCTITSRVPTGARDDYGDVLVTEQARDSVCYHEQTARTESGVADETWTVFFPPGEPIVRTDKITIGGVSFELVGGPYATRNPRTGEAGQVEATLRRTDG